VTMSLVTSWLADPGPSLHVLEGGHRDGAAPLVLVHELGGRVESWRGVVAALAPSTRWLAYDQRGHGLSEKGRGAYGLDEQVGDLDRVLAARDVTAPCWLVAAAAGAAIAVGFALRQPARVAGLVLCAPALETGGDRRDALLARARLAERDGMRAITDDALARSWPEVLRADPSSRAWHAEYRAQFLANDPVSYGLATRALADVDLAGRWQALRVPCLVLAGAHDLQRPPARLAAQAEAIPGARFETVAAGHLMAAQAPTQVAARIEAFVKEHSR
jgi:3-oxoadipate enol-lactonase